MAFSLEEQLLYQQGDKVEDVDMIKGRSVDIWISALSGYDSLPEEITIECDSIAAIGASTISVTASKEVTLYRNDVLKFTGDNFVVVKATTTIGTTATTLPVYALETGLTATDKASTYGMMPIWSAKEGAYPQASASYAEAHNKNMGLYAVSQKIREDYTVTISGDVNFKDPALDLFQSLQTSALSKVFIQARHAVTTEITVGATTYKYGEGPGAIQYKGNATINLTDPEAGMIGFSMEVKVSGKIDDYKILTPPV